ncbi:MAG: protoporphyrinogen oxidase [Candidatus Binatia bacterium]|nr:protoporphyrinogen oxidase [Candidatus Binatia bacterium]
MEAQQRPRLVVIGAGITGLAAAHRAWEKSGDSVDVRVLEASPRAGGVIATEKQGELLLEGGPDSFVTDKPGAINLCRRIGLEDEIHPTQEQFRKTLIVSRGRLHSMPDAFQLMAPAKLGPFLRSPVLSWKGRLTALKDLVLPRGGPAEGGDESLASFVRRRLGDEVLDRIAQPMIGGIYTADPETLSLASTMPRFIDMERDHRSVVLALAARMRQAPNEAASGPRYGIFVSLRGGIGALVERLVERLPPGALRTNAPVARMTRDEAGPRPWKVHLENGDAEEADAVIVSAPAQRASTLLSDFDGALGAGLGEIAYSSAAIVSLAYRRADVPFAPKAFGFVVPFVEGRKIIAGSFSSIKYAGRAPEDQLLVRIFVGGALQPEVLENDDTALAALVREELRDLLGIRSEPSLTRIHRWPSSMPQYYVGHAGRVRQLEQQAAAHPGLALAGNAYHGVGLADCIRDGEEASARMLGYLQTSGRSEGPVTT